MSTQFTRIALAAALTGAGIIALAGCTSEPAAQTKAEACNIVSASLSSVGDEVSDAYSSLGDGDIASAQEAVADVTKTVRSVEKMVEHPKVKAALGDVHDSMDAMSAVVDSLAEAGALDDVTKLSEASTTAATAIADLQSSADAINKICS
jgi:methyl-accepting chemotaxis protein